MIHRFARIHRTPRRRESVARTVSPETRSSVRPSSKATSAAIGHMREAAELAESFEPRLYEVAFVDEAPEEQSTNTQE